MLAVVGMAKLGVDFDASCIITHAYQLCLLHWPPGFVSELIGVPLHASFSQCVIKRFIYLASSDLIRVCISKEIGSEQIPKSREFAFRW